MHIILAALGSIITILILLNRISQTGLDLGWLNPLTWGRRRAWKKLYHANPAYSLTSPMEVIALLMYAAAKSEGEISSNQKLFILKKFQSVFHLDEEQATQLLSSSTFLLKETEIQDLNIKQVLTGSKDNFNSEQAQSGLELIRQVANLEESENAFQKKIIQIFSEALIPVSQDHTTWH